MEAATWVTAFCTFILAIATINLAIHTRRLSKSSDGLTNATELMAKVAGAAAKEWRSQDRTRDEIKRIMDEYTAKTKDNEKKKDV